VGVVFPVHRKKPIHRLDRRTVQILESWLFKAQKRSRRLSPLDFVIAKNRVVCFLEKRLDRSHLKKFKSDINSDHPIKNTQNAHSKLSAFRLSSQKVCNHLSKKGCIKNKTENITYPNHISEKYDADFIRGYFDGDGYVGTDDKNPEWMIYSGSEDFITQTQNKLTENNIQTRKTRDGNAIYLSNPKTQIKELYDFLYDDTNRKLKRKHSTFVDILS